MDTDWTVSSSSWYWEEDITFRNSYWTREEDKAFENALALYHDDADRWDKIAAAVPGKTIEDIHLHYEALSADVMAIDSGELPVPQYPSNATVPRKRKKSSRIGVKRGTPWSVKEHRDFLEGLEKYGRGDWKSIARNCVGSKTNSQVASHAQKYFKRLSLGDRAGRRPSINDIRNVNPEPTTPAVETPPVPPVYPNEDSTSTDNQVLVPPTPFSGVVCASQFPSQTMMSAEVGPGLNAWNMFTGPFGSQPMQEPVYSVEMMSAYHHQPSTDTVMQENGVASYGSFDIPYTSEFGDLDMEEFVLPHFLD